MQELTGKTAVISGAARGIGLAIATALHAAGATVIIADIDVDTATRSAAQLGPAGAGPAAGRRLCRELPQLD